MKKSVLLIGIIVLLLNSVIGISLSSYKLNNILLVDFSLLISTSLIFYLFNYKLSDAFKIGLSLFFLITGSFRVILALFIHTDYKDNFNLLLFLFLIAIEIISIVLVKYLNNSK